MAPRATESAATISGGRRKRSPKSWMATTSRTVRTTDCTRTNPVARRKKVRACARLCVASARAMNVVTPSSSPRMANFARRSVVAHATENIPRAAGPSSRAIRKVKMPRKFAVMRPTVFKRAPRFSSAPVRSASDRPSTDGGGAWHVFSIALTRSTRVSATLRFLSMLAPFDQVQLQVMMLHVDDGGTGKSG